MRTAGWWAITRAGSSTVLNFRMEYQRANRHSARRGGSGHVRRIAPSFLSHSTGYDTTRHRRVTHPGPHIGVPTLR